MRNLFVFIEISAYLRPQVESHGIKHLIRYPEIKALQDLVTLW